MNRHYRRKAAKTETKTFTKEELSAMGRICGWRDCQATCRGDLPDGWVNVICYASPRAQAESAGNGKLAVYVRDGQWRHDKVLCAEHAAALDDLLFQTRLEIMDMPVHGQA